MNTMTKALLSTVVVLGIGCNGNCPPDAPTTASVAGPSSAALETAMAVAWDVSMERASRPAIRWFDDSACEGKAVQDGPAKLRVGGACPVFAMDSASGVVVGWHPGARMADTHLADALAAWKVWLMTSRTDDMAMQNHFAAEMRQAFASTCL